MIPCSQCRTVEDVSWYEWSGVESGFYLCHACMLDFNNNYDPVSQSFKGSEHYNAYYNNGLDLKSWCHR